MTSIINIPLDKLRPGEKAKGGSINSRKADAPVDSLAASIAQHGLLVPLLVRKNGADFYDVMDGNRRYAALLALAKKDHEVADIIPCVEHAAGNALELSMVVNVEREGLHPVDQFEVYAALVQGGETVDALSKRYGKPVKEIRQALALGKLAPEIRDAWRDGKMSAETAEAFTLTSDRDAQVKVLKRLGKGTNDYAVRRALSGNRDDQDSVSSMLKLVGREAYEKAGHQINSTLFTGEDGTETVSDIAALLSMVDDKLQAECDKLIADGWKWAIPKSKAPNDIHSWRRLHPDSGKFTKDVMAGAGCIVQTSYRGDAIERVLGYVKPGAKVTLPKSPKAKKAAAKEREQRQEETGGLSNALAFRLSKQLTLMVREAFAAGITGNDAIAFTIAALACGESPSRISLGTECDDDRHENEFVKYYKLAAGKPMGERCDMLALWLSKSIDLTCHSSEDYVKILHPDKGDDRSTRVLVEQIQEREMKDSAIKLFDSADYFASVNKALIVEAVHEALGKEHSARVEKMKAEEARKYAIAHVPKTGWVPQSMRLGKA